MRWALQKGLPIVPSTTDVARLFENLRSIHVTSRMSKAEMLAIENLPESVFFDENISKVQKHRKVNAAGKSENDSVPTLEIRRFF